MRTGSQAKWRLELTCLTSNALPLATYLVGDTASQFPYSLKYLHLGGLAASDNLFNVTPVATKKGHVPTTHLDSIVALRLDDCPRLSVNGFFGALRHGHFKSLVRLHAYWLDRDDVYGKSTSKFIRDGCHRIIG